MIANKLKISVVIPTCNRPDKIKKAIRSVLNQTFQDFEVVVVDDGIKARAEEAVKSFADPRIKYIQHEKNKGGSAARNTGIKNSQADWIAFLDDDDEWLPEKLARQWEVIKRHGDEIGFIFGGVKFINKVTGEERVKIPPERGVYDYYEDVLSLKSKMMTSSIVIKKSVLADVGGFDESFPTNQETELNFRITKKYKGVAIGNAFTTQLINHGDHVGGNLERRIEGRQKLLDKYISEIIKRKYTYFIHLRGLGNLYRLNRQGKKAVKFYFLAWKNNKGSLRELILALYSLIF